MFIAEVQYGQHTHRLYTRQRLLIERQTSKHSFIIITKHIFYNKLPSWTNLLLYRAMSHALYIMACCNGKNWFKYVTALSNSSLRICSCRFLSLFYKISSIYRLYVGKRPLTVHEREKNGCLFDLNC